MAESRDSRKSATAVGFVAGAAVIIILAAVFMFRSDRSAPSTAAPTAAVAPQPEVGGQPANPHSFPAERSAAPGPPLLAGTIDIDSSISQAPGATVTVFVIARAGDAKGPAVMAKRFDVEKFPLEFSLSNADLMMAGQTPEVFTLEARIDLDGDAMTREPASPIATQNGVPVGSTRLALTMRPTGGL